MGTRERGYLGANRESGEEGINSRHELFTSSYGSPAGVHRHDLIRSSKVIVRETVRLDETLAWAAPSKEGHEFTKMNSRRDISAHTDYIRTPHSPSGGVLSFRVLASRPVSNFSKADAARLIP